MSAMLDIIVSMVFGAVLMLIIFSANEIVNDSVQETHGNMLVQSALTSIVQIVEGEFRNAGAGTSYRQRPFLSADTSQFAFVGDLDGNMVADTVRYALGNASEMVQTPNEYDRPLYRKVNNESWCVVANVTVFHLTYYDVTGDIIPTPITTRLPEIHVVEVTIEVQNPYGVHTPNAEIYPTSMWQQTRLSSQNSKR